MVLCLRHVSRKRVGHRNDVQDAAAESRVVIDCPTSRIGLVIGRHGATIRALERTYDVCIETVHCQHPAQIIIEGAALAVDAAAVDVRELINRGWQHLDPPGTGRSRFGGPEGPGSSTGTPYFVSELCTERP